MERKFKWYLYNKFCSPGIKVWELHKYVSDLSKSYHEIENINRILSKNKFPNKGFDKCIFKFLDNQSVGKPQIASARQKNWWLSYIFLLIRQKLLKLN